MSVKKPEKKIFSKTVGDVYPIRMFPTFADPKNDFIFKRIFGSDSHKDLLIELLNALLELDDKHKIVAVDFLPPEQQIPIKNMKSTIVDVRCQDVNGVHYVVEMQSLIVSQMEKRVVYNVCKDYVLQLKRAEAYPELNDVIAITICGFCMWDDRIPMLSHFRMQEQHSGELGLSQLQYVFLELPKYTAGDQPKTLIEKWAYFFKETVNFDKTPKTLKNYPFSDALELSKVSALTIEEWDFYQRMKIAEQDAKGRLQAAEQQGLEQGMTQGLEQGLKQGLKQGLQEGIQQGVQQGLQQGLEQGMAQGIQQGMAQGIQQGLIGAISDIALVLDQYIPTIYEPLLMRLTEKQLIFVRDYLKYSREWPHPNAWPTELNPFIQFGIDLSGLA